MATTEKKMVKVVRYLLSYRIGNKWFTMCGKSGERYLFSSEESARAYAPTLWSNVPDICGLQIRAEQYYIEAGQS